jgi:hypothetical protein
MHSPSCKFRLRIYSLGASKSSVVTSVVHTTNGDSVVEFTTAGSKVFPNPRGICRSIGGLKAARIAGCDAVSTFPSHRYVYH